MMRLPRFVAGTVLALALAVSCPVALAQGTGAAETAPDLGEAVKGLFNFIGRAVGGILDRKGSEFKALIEADKIREAAAFYVANEADLLKSESAKALFPRLAERLGAQLGGESATLLARLDAMRELPPAGEWRALRADLGSAVSTVNRIESSLFFRRQAALKPAWVKDINAARARVEAMLVDNVAKAFVGYDHLNHPSFLDAYPVALSDRLRSGIAVKASGVWLAAMLRGTEAQAQSLVRTYTPLLPSADSRMLVSIAYADAVSRARGMRSPRTLQQTMQLMQALRDAGLDPAPAARDLRVALVRGLMPPAEEPAWPSEAIGLPVQQIDHGALANWAKDVAVVKPTQTYVLIDASRLMLHSGVRSVDSRTGKRSVGQRETANPALDGARKELESARADLAQAEQLDQQNQAQAQDLVRQSRGSGFTTFGAMASSALSTVGLQSARDRVSKAEQEYQNMPRTVRTPVMQDYRVAVASIEVVKVQEVGVYIVDGSSGRFARLTFNETSRTEGGIDLGVAPSDPDSNAVGSRNEASTQRLTQFAREGVPLHAGEVWKRLQSVDAGAAMQPVAELAKAMQEDHKRWRAASAAEQARLKSVAQQGEAQALRIADAQ